MPYEIERKFLVRADCWRMSAGRPSLIQQGYLTRNRSISLRVRLIDKAKAMLTIKSVSAEIRRLEFEYEIPMADGAALIGMRESGLVEKLRHKLPWYGLTWEIDVFLGENQGLIIAEIELPHEDCEFEKPGWLGREVTFDPRFSNANLARTPFGRWRSLASAAQTEAAYLAPPTD
jgi:adenylate cyclase